MNKPVVLRKADIKTQEYPWGSLTWFAGQAVGNSQEITVGKCVIHPGQANPRHNHPNCCEVLVVMQGKISHTLDEGKECTLTEGDVISVPPHVAHQARNIGDTDAVLFITFSAGDRQTKGE